MHTGDWVRLVFARVPCVVVLMCHSLSRYSRPHKHCHFSVIPDKAAMWFCFPKYLSCCFSWMQCSRKQFVFHKFFFHFRRYFYKQTKYKRRIASSRRHPYIIRTVQCWRFITHNHLRINFTIHEIVFSARHVNCTKGFFGMSSIAVNLKQTDTILSFCEKYPKMRVYVSKNQFKAHISVDNYVAFAVQFSFSVINSYSAIHLPENQYKTDLKGTSPAQLSNSKSHNSRPPWTLFFLKKDSFLYNCHLVVHKIYKILLFLPNYRLLCYQIFDSPRPTSTSLNLTYTQMEKAIFSTTSFQCFVQMQLTSSAKNMISCEYRSVIVNNSFDIFLSENMSTPYFFISTINFLSQVLVQAPSGHFINGTFKYFNYNGSDSSACFYGGVSAYKNSSQTLTEIFMSCQHHKGVLEHIAIILRWRCTKWRFTACSTAFLVAKQQLQKPISFSVLRWVMWLAIATGGDIQTVAETVCCMPVRSTHPRLGAFHWTWPLQSVLGPLPSFSCEAKALFLWENADISAMCFCASRFQTQNCQSSFVILHEVDRFNVSDEANVVPLFKAFSAG